MRRGLAILLVLFFGLGPLSATLEASDDAYLPACCRRHGAHHCAMAARMAVMAAAQRDTKPAFSAPQTCPYYPGAAAVLTSPIPALAAVVVALPFPRTQAYELATIRTRVPSRPGRTYAGRGPPLTI